MPMHQGKAKCETLKAIRKKIADANGIPYEPVKCTHEGDCRGTCPACESEVRYIENQLNIRKLAGKAVKIVGLASAMTLAACSSISNQPSINPEDPNAEMEELDGDISIPAKFQKDEFPEMPFIPVEDTVYAEGEDLFDEIIHAECPNGIDSFLRVNLEPQFATDPDSVVTVIFNVDADGSISNVRVKEPVNPKLDKAAISVVQKMPKWTPAMSNGRQVRSKFHVSILFDRIPPLPPMIIPGGVEDHRFDFDPDLETDEKDTTKHVSV